MYTIRMSTRRLFGAFALALTLPLITFLPAQAGAAAIPLTRNISFGSRGGDVAVLQRLLISEGLLASEATGYFGALTQAAVQRFQAQNGIVSSGSPSTTGYGAVGPKTRAFIASGAGASAPSTTGNASASSIADDPNWDDSPAQSAAASSKPITVTSAPDTTEASYDSDLSAIDALLQETSTEQDIDTDDLE